MTNLSGQTLGQYQVIEKIGQGGMGTVYKAHQPNLDRHVALKVLFDQATQPTFKERFEREAKTVANLNHPHILPIYGYGQDGPYTFIVMRYVEGSPTLEDVMTAPLPLAQAVDLIEQIAAALTYAHHRGVIHRDVKPSNILLDDQWILLADFGLVKLTEGSTRLTETGVGIGTAAYMSPEQAQAQAVDHRTDIYALGVILFEMLTGHIPHDADNSLKILLNRLSEPTPSPRALNPTIPEAVEQVVLEALALDPERRYDSAEALADALRAAVDGLETPSVVQLKIQREGAIEDFTPVEQGKFIRGLAALINLSLDQIRILAVDSDNVQITLEIPEEAAQILLKMYSAGDPALKTLHIAGLERQQSPAAAPPVSKPNEAQVVSPRSEIVAGLLPATRTPEISFSRKILSGLARESILRNRPVFEAILGKMFPKYYRYYARLPATML